MTIVRIADGVWAQAEDRSAALPPHLDTDAHVGRTKPCYPRGGTCRPLVSAMAGVREYPVVMRGTRLACRDRHDYGLRMTGRYGGLDLRLYMCRFCQVIEVRDVSRDLIVDEDPSGRRLYITPQAKARRKDAVLGHYSGRRSLGRVYA